MVMLNIFFGIVQFFLIIYILIEEVKRKSPAAFLWATLFMMFGFPHLITAFTNDMGYSASVILQASIFVCGFCTVYILFRTKKEFEFITLSNKTDSLEIEGSYLENSIFEHLCLLILVGSFLGLVFFLTRAQGGLFKTSWASSRSVEKNYVSFSGLASRLIFSFSGLSLYFFLTKRKLKGIFILGLFVLLVLITRNRVTILPVFTFFVVLYLIKIKTIRIRHLAIGLGLAIIAVYVIYALRAFRYLGTLSSAVDRFSWEYINSTVKRFLINRDGELGLRQYFYFFIYRDNHFEGFNKGLTYIRMALVYLPSRWSFGLKPQSFDLYMGQAIGMADGGSMHPTLFGDCFGNLWWFGMFLGGFWSGMVNVIERLISRQADDFFKIMIYFLSAYSFAVIARGSVYNGFEVLAWGVLLLYLIRVISTRFMKVKISVGDKTNM